MINVQNFFYLSLFLLVLVNLNGDDFSFPGEKPKVLDIHALVGGDIQINPEKRIKQGTILIRDGIIERVGKDFEIPPAYRIWKMEGKTIYPGLIDAYLLSGSSESGLLELDHDQHVYATADLSFHGVPSTRSDPGEKGPGFEVAGVHPQYKLVTTFQPDEKKWEDLRENGFTMVHIAPSDGIFRGTGPSVLLLNENPNDCIVKKEVAQILAFDPVGKEETPAVYPSSLMGVFSVIRQSFLEVEYAQQLLSYEAKNSTSLPFTSHSGILALASVMKKQNSMPIWIETGSCLMTNRAIKLSKEFNLSPVLIATGDEWRRPDLACSESLSYISPLIFPALANLKEEDDWEQISLDQLRAWDHAPSNPALLAKKTKSLSLTTTGTNFNEFHKNLLKAIERGLSKENALAALTTNPAKLLGAEKYAGTLESGKLANLFIVNGGNYFSKDVSIHSTWIKGRPFIHPVQKSQKNEKDEANASRIKSDQLVARFPSEDRKPINMPSSILFTNATIWTCSMDGKMKNGELFIENGKIRALGKTIKDLDRSKIKVIDLQGKHITPGIIDCHSHAMILGRVNESTLPSTAMVRIEDVINSESVNIERQLAGGVTTCNLLHGSANPIGGQNAVIKLRLGSAPDKLLIKNAPKGIKFALGENVKQANWGDKYTSRFPQSRMGVKMFFQNRFGAALAYEKKLKRGKKEGFPVKTNLELGAILEIIKGQRLIHCHSYRQDEILVFLRTMEGFGVRVGSLQHVLEGYKVADEISRHGAGASTFSDWWAYKFEVYDAIPYAGAIMHERGCVVSFNSDSPDHARRLNLEAAKAIKYGGLSEMEALMFITLNPAKQLGIDSWVGSLKVGKDADLAIWSGPPLDYRTKCEQTWVDGILLHETEASTERDKRRKNERLSLLKKAKQSLEKVKEHEPTKEAQIKFFRHSLETASDLHPHSCRSGQNNNQCVHQ